MSGGVLSVDVELIPLGVRREKCNERGNLQAFRARFTAGTVSDHKALLYEFFEGHPTNPPPLTTAGVGMRQRDYPKALFVIGLGPGTTAESEDVESLEDVPNAWLRSCFGSTRCEELAKIRSALRRGKPSADSVLLHARGLPGRVRADV